VLKSVLPLLPTVEVASIAEVATGTCAVPHNVAYGSGDVTSPMSPPTISPLSFSLMSERSRDQSDQQQQPKNSLADQVAENASRFSDWTDGLNMLRKDGGHVATTETAEFVQALTEIGLKIKLLGKFQTCATRPLTLRPAQIFQGKRLKFQLICLLVYPLPTPTFSLLERLALCTFYLVL
jgi:hypothetical protein